MISRLIFYLFIYLFFFFFSKKWHSVSCWYVYKIAAYLASEQKSWNSILTGSWRPWAANQLLKISGLVSSVNRWHLRSHILYTHLLSLALLYMYYSLFHQVSFDIRIDYYWLYAITGNLKSATGFFLDQRILSNSIDVVYILVYNKMRVIEDGELGQPCHAEIGLSSSQRTGEWYMSL